jgi:hypothetical protein
MTENYKKDFVPYEPSLALKELGFDEPCFATYQKGLNGPIMWDYWSIELRNSTNEEDEVECTAPLYQQAINFLYICSNKQIDIELKGSDTHEERIRKIEQGCKDLWNLQNNKSK